MRFTEIIKRNLFNICLACFIALSMGVVQNILKQLEYTTDILKVCQISEQKDYILMKCADSQQLQLGILNLSLAIKNMDFLWGYLFIVASIIIIKIWKDNFRLRY